MEVEWSRSSVVTSEVGNEKTELNVLRVKESLFRIEAGESSWNAGGDDVDTGMASAATAMTILDGTARLRQTSGRFLDSDICKGV